MSDLTASSQKSLSNRFASYLFAFALFFGVNTIYRRNDFLFDPAVGLMFGVFIYWTTMVFRQLISKFDSSLEQLIIYRNSGFKMRDLLKNGNFWTWIVPILILPYLLYKNDFPVRLITFGIGFFAGLVGAYLVRTYQSIRFYKKMEKYINWDLLQEKRN